MKIFIRVDTIGLHAQTESSNRMTSVAWNDVLDCDGTEKAIRATRELFLKLNASDSSTPHEIFVSAEGTVKDNTVQHQAFPWLNFNHILAALPVRCEKLWVVMAPLAEALGAATLQFDDVTQYRRGVERGPRFLDVHLGITNDFVWVTRGLHETTVELTNADELSVPNHVLPTGLVNWNEAVDGLSRRTSGRASTFETLSGFSRKRLDPGKPLTFATVTTALGMTTLATLSGVTNPTWNNVLAAFLSVEEAGKKLRSTYSRLLGFQIQQALLARLADEVVVTGLASQYPLLEERVFVESVLDGPSLNSRTQLSQVSIGIVKEDASGKLALTGAMTVLNNAAAPVFINP